MIASASVPGRSDAMREPPPAGSGQDVDRAEEQQDGHGDPDHREEVLAAARRQAQLHPGLGERRRDRRRRSAHAAPTSWR